MVMKRFDDGLDVNDGLAQDLNPAVGRGRAGVGDIGLGRTGGGSAFGHDAGLSHLSIAVSRRSGADRPFRSSVTLRRGGRDGAEWLLVMGLDPNLYLMPNAD